MPSIDRVIEQIVSQLPGYEPRPQQVEMARVITEATRTNRHAIIEAGTGSGKSFGYLIPLLERGDRVVIATGTIALQEQLLNKDLPFLAQAYGREIKFALAKGRSNYVCLRKLEEANRTLPPGDVALPVIESLSELARTREWNGDRAQLPYNVENRLWMEQLASDPEDCLGPRCPNFEFTPHREARQALADAQVIVANHALYFTDLALDAGLIPEHKVVVFDEAHHLERAASSALTTQVSRWMPVRILQRVQRRFRNVPAQVLQAISDAEAEMMDALYRQGRGQFRIEADRPFRDMADRLAEAFTRLSLWLASADTEQMLLLDADPGMAKARAETQRDQMASVAKDLGARWAHFATLSDSGERANWMQVDPARDYYELNSAPLDVGQMLGQLLWSKRTCILTSATLAVDGGFGFLKRELGLPEDALEAELGSPFDFPRQALFYVPRAMPVPSDPRFGEAAAAEIERILMMTRGRAFVLCTSYRSLRELSSALLPRLPYPCKTQEDLPRARLVEWFRSTPNAVLFATASFWEGVDVPGEALSCVIIDKLPFASPDDPVVQARTDRMKARGEDWFGGYVLPRAVLQLKQGFGRLIRTKTDTGLVALLDRRVLTMRYGETVMRSLPPARRLPALAPSLEAALRAPVRTERDWSGYEAGPDMARSSRIPPPDLEAVLGEPLP